MLNQVRPCLACFRKLFWRTPFTLKLQNQVRPLKQPWAENDCRKYFMANLHESMVPDTCNKCSLMISCISRSFRIFCVLVPLNVIIIVYDDRASCYHVAISSLTSQMPIYRRKIFQALEAVLFNFLHLYGYTPENCHNTCAMT